MRQHDGRLWSEFWHLICHRSEVADPRDFVRFDVAGEEVAAFHDGNEVVVFDNLCPHRGARIFDGNAGNARFSCRYHGWSFAKGKLFVARKEQFGHCGAEALTLPQMQTCWVGDFLFASPAPTRSIEEQLGADLETVAQISRSITSRDDFNSYSYDCDWQIAIENALEAYHVSAIHPNSLDKLKLADGRFTFEKANSTWRTEVRDETLGKRLGKISRFFDLEFQHPGYINIFLFPFTMLSSTFGYSYSIQHFLPMPQTDRSHFLSRLYRSRLREKVNPEMLAGFFDSTAEINRQVFAEDNAICARVPSRAWSPEPPRLYAESEERLLHFRQSYRAATGC